VKKLTEKRFSITDRETGYKKRLIRRRFRTPSGVTTSFLVDDSPNSVVVFAVTEAESHVLLVKQHRPGPDRIMLELPGGGFDHPGEGILECAARELREETGYTAETLVHLCTLPYQPYSTGVKHIVFARGCKPSQGGQDLDPLEFIEVVTTTPGKLHGLCLEGAVLNPSGALIGLERMKQNIVVV
jgi:ADP-ribose pyrophosphatase